VLVITLVCFRLDCACAPGQYFIKEKQELLLSSLVVGLFVLVPIDILKL
jgi:hypothetical protein